MSYQGPDRRERTVGWSGRVALADVVKDAGALLLGMLVPVGFALARGAGEIGTADFLRALGGILALAAGVASLIAWRILGRAFAALFGILMTDFALLTLVTSFVPTASSTPTVAVSTLGTLVTTGVCAAVGWNLLRSPEVDSGLAPIPILGLSVAGGLAVLGALSFFDSRGLLGGALGTEWAWVAARALAALAWGTGAGMAELRRRAGEAVPAWVPVVFGVLAAGQLERAVLPAGGIAALAGSAVILGAFVLAATASLGDLRWILRSQDRLSMSLRFDLNSLRRQMEAERASLEDRLHDLRNAVAALRSADTTLRRYAGRLDEASRNRLADALTTELGRLQVLIEPARSASRVEFPIEEAIAPVVTVERSYGAVIHLDLGKLVGLGDPASLAQVLQNLLENARRYAGGSPVEVSTRERAGRIEIRVKDHGPGIPEHERAAIFSRGIRGSSSEETSGTGLGLFIAARLMIEMGGSLRLEETGAAGSCFLVEVPVAHRSGLGAVEPPTASVS